MTRVLIDDVAEILNGYAFDSDNFNTTGNGLPIVRIRDVVPGFSETYYAGDFPEGYVLQNGDLLIGMDGEFNIANWKGGKALLNQRVCKVTPKSEIADASFLKYGLSVVLKEIEANTPFVTVKHLSSEDLKQTEIELPPLTEQRRIAALLDKADKLRRTRRYATQLSDTFLQAVFVRMFGDVVRNPMGWEIYSLRDVAVKFSDGPFGSDLKTEHYTDSGVRVIRLQNIGVGELIDDDKAYISQEHFDELAKHRCEPGDVIVGTMGDPNLRACILPLSIQVALNKADCTQIRVDTNIANAQYICQLLNMPSTLHLANGMILGETRARISMGRLAELRVPIASLVLQEKFARIVQQFERLRAQQREAERQAEHLFQTLLHRAFSGER